NFALFSENATAVHVCFFDEAGKQVDCVKLRERTAFVWHGLVRGIKAGLRFNSSKLLVDPYAKAISGEPDHKGPIYPYDVMSGDDTKKDETDSADFVPKSVVVDSHFDWGTDCLPDTPIADSVIYEMHVRGFSMRN